MSLFDKKGIGLAAGFDYQAEQPLDSRYICNTYKEIQDLISGKAAYPGLKVFCLENNRMYLFDKNSSGSIELKEETTHVKQEIDGIKQETDAIRKEIANLGNITNLEFKDLGEI